MNYLMQHIFILLTYFMPNYFKFKNKNMIIMAGWVQLDPMIRVN